MSSGPFTYSLSAAAAFALRVLYEQPDRGTPEEIADSPEAAEGMDADAVRGGLDELAAQGLAAQTSEGRWEITDDGRAAQQPA